MTTIAQALGLKYDTDKPQMHLVPPKALLEVAKVLGYGAKKYSADNWRHVDHAFERYYGAAQRHQWQWLSGETLDPETKINHIAHAICSLMFILELELEQSKAESKGSEETNGIPSFL